MSIVGCIVDCTVYHNNWNWNLAKYSRVGGPGKKKLEQACQCVLAPGRVGLVAETHVI